MMPIFTSDTTRLSYSWKLVAVNMMQVSVAEQKGAITVSTKL